MATARDVLARLRQARSVVLTSQSPLDGDSIGSEVALLVLLPRLVPGLRVEVLNESPPPDRYAFLLEGIRLGVLGPQDPAPSADLLVVLDCGDLDRFRYLPARFAGVPILNVDHHASNPGFGQLAWVDPQASSTGEMILQLVEEAGAELPRRAAEALYVALVFDTGRFAYSNTRPTTLRRAAQLLEVGVDPHEIHRQLERNRPLAALRLQGTLLARLQVAAGGRLAWVAVARRDLEAMGTREEDLEDFVNLPLTAQGVEVSLLLKEIGPATTKASLRSDRWFDVAAFAARFGGGGHRHAAGLLLDVALPEAVSRLVPALEQALGTQSTG